MNHEYVFIVDGEGYFEAATPVDVPLVESPEVPPPVWDARPIDADRAMAAVRAMCGG